MRNKKGILYTFLLVSLGFCLVVNTAQAQDQINQLQNKVNQLQDHWINLQNNQIDITNKLKKQNQQLEREIEKLRQQLQRLETQAQQMPDQVANKTRQQQNKLQELEQSLQAQKEARNNTISTLQQKNAEINGKLQNLKKSLKTLKQKQKAKTQEIINKTNKQEEQFQEYSSNLKQMIDKQKKRMNLVNKNLQKVYKQTLSEVGGTQRYNLGVSADLNTSYYSIDRDMNDVSALGENVWTYPTDKNGKPQLGDDSDNAFLNTLDLKLYGQIGKELQLTSTLSMYKLWGSWTHPMQRGISDFNYSSSPSTAGISVRTAYADYRPEWLNRTFNLTFGRLPTAGGHLSKFRHNEPSPSSYPDLAYNSETDGIAGTLYPNKMGIPGLTSLNMVYIRSVEDTDSHPYQTDPAELDDIDFYTLQLNSDPPFMEDATFTVHAFRMDNIRPSKNELIAERTKDSFASKFSSLSRKVGYSSNYNFQDQFKDGINVDFPEELGTIDKLTLQFDDERFLGTPIDFFASYSLCRVDRNDEQIQIDYDDLKGPPQILNSLPKKLQDGPYYLASGDNQGSDTSFAIYTGLRYNLEQEWLNNPKFGAEYNYGSQYWVGLNIADRDPFHKLNIRGQAYEGYWIQPLIEDKFQIRTGYQYLQRDYTTSLLSGVFGAPREVDETAKVFYLDLNLRF